MLVVQQLSIYKVKESESELFASIHLYKTTHVSIKASPFHTEKINKANTIQSLYDSLCSGLSPLYIPQRGFPK